MPLQLSLPSPASADLLAARTPQRARHDIKLRVTTVQSATRITPHMVRVVVHSQDLAGFTSLGFDDHVKLLFPDASGQLQLPAPGSEGLPPELREKVFKNMSSRAAEMLREDLEARGPVRLSEVEAEQKEILKTVRRLAEEGQVMLGGKGGDDGFV